MPRDTYVPAFATALLLILMLACGPCGLFSGSVPTPPHGVRLSAESADRLQARLESSLRGAPGQPFALLMTDSELTSLVSSKLAQYGRASVVQDPVIWFTPGQINATGRLVHVLPAEVQFFLVAKPRVGAGSIALEIPEISAGSVTMPDSVRDMLSQSINETLDELQLGIVVTGVEILEGQAVIEGLRTQTAQD